MKKPYILILLIISTFFCFSMPTYAEKNAVTGNGSDGNVVTNSGLRSDIECYFKVNEKDLKKCTLLLYRQYNVYTAGGNKQFTWNWDAAGCKGYSIVDDEGKKGIQLKVIEKNPKENSKWCPSKFHYKINKDKKTIKISLSKIKNETGVGTAGLKDREVEEAQNQAQDAADQIQSPTDKEKILTSMTVGKEYKACDQLLSDGVVSVLKEIFIIIEIATPIILIIMSMIDFTKAVVSSDNDAVNKALARFIKRLLIAAAIFLAPTFVEFILDVTGLSDGVCGIG